MTTSVLLHYKLTDDAPLAVTRRPVHERTARPAHPGQRIQAGDKVGTGPRRHNHHARAGTPAAAHDRLRQARSSNSWRYGLEHLIVPAQEHFSGQAHRWRPNPGK
jgi:hypothetical protein